MSLSADHQATHLITWRNAEIQDFIRRLGFAKLESGNENFGRFTRLNEVTIIVIYLCIIYS